MNTKILAFAGSLRSESYNKKLVKIAAAGARATGAEVQYIDLRDYPLPIFDEDLEAEHGLHPNARQLKDLFLASQGFLISSPEYNSSMSAAFKNAIDWVSRPVEGEAAFAPFSGKVVGLMSASPGALGGLRGLVVVRMLLGNLRMIVLPDQIALSKAHEAFLDDGSLKDKKQQQGIEALGATVARVCQKLTV